MDKPLFFQRRPEVVQAIQVVDGNSDTVRAFLNGKKIDIVGYDYVGDWVVKNSDGRFELYTDESFRQKFMQQHETL